MMIFPVPHTYLPHLVNVVCERPLAEKTPQLYYCSAVCACRSTQVEFWTYFASNTAAIAQRSIAVLLHSCFGSISGENFNRLTKANLELLLSVLICNTCWKHLTLNYNFKPFKYCLVWKYFNCYGEFSAARWNCAEDFRLPKSWWPHSMCQSVQKIQ